MRRGARCGCWRGKEGGGLRSRWGRIRAGQVAGRVVQVPWLAVGEGCHEQAATTDQSLDQREDTAVQRLCAEPAHDPSHLGGLP